MQSFSCAPETINSYDLIPLRVHYPCKLELDARSTPVEGLGVFWVESTVRSSLTLYSLSGSDEGRLINGLNAGVPESIPVDESEVF